MRKVFMAGLVAMAATAGACDTVEVVIVPLPGADAQCVTVDGTPYCSPDQVEKELPDSGPFTVEVDGLVYTLDASSPGGASLETVYVVIGSTYVLGVYEAEEGVDVRGFAEAEAAGQCVTCPNGAVVCGYNPRCPK